MILVVKTKHFAKAKGEKVMSNIYSKVAMPPLWCCFCSFCHGNTNCICWGASPIRPIIPYLHFYSLLICLMRPRHFPYRSSLDLTADARHPLLSFISYLNPRRPLLFLSSLFLPPQSFIHPCNAWGEVPYLYFFFTLLITVPIRPTLHKLRKIEPPRWPINFLLIYGDF